MLICTLIYLITKPLIISQNVLKGCRLLKKCVSTPGRSVCWCISQGMCFSLLFVLKKKRKLSESLIPCYSKNKGSVALRGSSCWLEKRMILQILTKIVSQWRLKGAVMECKWVGQAAAEGPGPFRKVLQWMRVYPVDRETKTLTGTKQ